MTSRIERFLIALMFALLAAGVTLIIASAEGENPPVAPTAPQECANCHTDSQETWLNGAHGKAEVVTCDTCHQAAPADHPESPMPVDRSPDLCVSCHSDTRFGLQDWKASKHSQLGIDCASCHDPHSTSLKKIAGPRGEAPKTDDVSALCTNCHKDHNSGFSLTTHNKNAVTCVDCHVNPIEDFDGTPRTVTNHTFKANLASCNDCHSEQMHSDAEAKAPVVAPIAGEPGAEAHPSLAAQPEPVGPMGFSALAGIIGLAGGMVLAPWLERWYRRTTKSNREEDNE